MVGSDRACRLGAQAPVGVLALQGGFEAHQRCLRRLGRRSVLIRQASDLEHLSGLILPGGESTAQLKLIRSMGLEQPLVRLIRDNTPVLATCAGLILLARQVRSPAQESLALLDVSVERNSYGRQLDSFEAVSPAGLPLMFIRAPRITRVGRAVTVHERYDGHPILVQQGEIWGAAFHPELTSSLDVHQRVFGTAPIMKAS